MNAVSLFSIIKIRSVGNSKGIILPSDWLDKLNVSVGDYIDVNVKKVTEKQLKRVKQNRKRKGG